MPDKQPTLYVFSGLPGSGKTTLSTLLAQHIKAAYLRIDTIEQGLKDLCRFNAVGEGYQLSYRLATDNLKLGVSVIADSCNPIELTRQSWQGIAAQAGALCHNIEVICSDKAEHRRRVEQRTCSIAGLKLPSWQQVQARDYHPWERPRLLIDTAGQTPRQSLETLLAVISQTSGIS
ncbi:AAA family ATPase [Dongshaea marina]|uniref:AAA family ATPase n=1 Tax=Dongshaea marina TaxID=2047966 RepID=UPI000D3EA632|nr:AAA family ATPase [Dongshaea marina]